MKCIGLVWVMGESNGTHHNYDHASTRLPLFEYHNSRETAVCKNNRAGYDKKNKLASLFQHNTIMYISLFGIFGCIGKVFMNENLEIMIQLCINYEYVYMLHLLICSLNKVIISCHRESLLILENEPRHCKWKRWKDKTPSAPHPRSRSDPTLLETP